MNHDVDVLDRVGAMAPSLPADPDGLAGARALLADATRAPAHETGDLADLVELVEVTPVRRRTRRRGVATALVVTGAAAAVAGAAFVAASVLQPPRLEPVIPAGIVLGPDCRPDPISPLPIAERRVAAEDLSSMPEVASSFYLLADAVPDSLLLDEYTYPCGTAHAVAIFSSPDGLAGVTLFADIGDPWTQVAADETEDVTVRGTTGRELTPDGGHHFLLWTEPTGIRWFAIADGISVAELVDLLDDAPLGRTRVGADLEVPGMRRVPQARLLRQDTDPVKEYVWMVRYDAGTLPGLAVGDVRLDVALSDPDPIEARASWPGEPRLTAVGGVPARYFAGVEGGSILKWRRDGLAFALLVEGDYETTMKVAELVERVPLSDDRVHALAD